jgi:hypothetical protein
MKKYFFFSILGVVAALGVFLVVQEQKARPFSFPKISKIVVTSTPVATPILVVSPIPTPVLGTSSASLNPRTKTTNCLVRGSLPDPDCTPGSVFTVTAERVCASGYAKSARDVSSSLKRQVYAEYGILTHGPNEYEVDHLISLELGGSNDIANLWPESAVPNPGFHEKDKVENFLHDQVCKGKISLEDAQFIIARDWMSVFSEAQKISP